MDAEHSSAELATKPVEKEEECSVCVAVNIRPLIGHELIQGCQECLTVDAAQAQVSCCGRHFLFDRVYGSCNASPPENLFVDCIQPLVEALFKGYNATVLAYGQTGSGKTYTMGSAFTPGQAAVGVIPSVLDQIFDRIKAMPLTACTVRASFVEIHKEEVRDLLVFGENQAKLNRTTSVSVREVPGGGVCLAGATEREVTSKEETGELLLQGTQFRATASTNMNAHSSRSHAIFTITLEQRKQVSLMDDSQKNSDDEDEGGAEEETAEDFLTAKMHLVDLAGSERAKRTGAEGNRLKEGIDINRGLLALGKVISSLVDNHRHIPYRDSKLTRLLQDSLGGNSRTVMIACVSPADLNSEESINTLRYANRARSIKNKPVVNRDPVAAQFAALRQQLALVRSELAMYKKAANGEEIQMGGSDPLLQEELEKSEERRRQLDAENARLRIQLESAQRDAKDSKTRQMTAQCQCDTYKMNYNQLKQRVEQLEKDGMVLPDPPESMDAMGSEDVIQGYLDRIAELEQENLSLKDLKAISQHFMQRTSIGASNNANLHLRRSSYVPIPELEQVDQELADEQMDAAEEEAYRLEQQRLGEELSTLEKSLERKEMQIKKVAATSTQVEVMRQQFEKQVRALENKRTKLELERQELAMKLQNLKAMSHEEQLRLEEHYRHQLKERDEELKELKRKEKEFMKIEKLKRKTEDACTKLKTDVERIKAQKVKLHKQIELKNKEHHERMKHKEREMMHLKKQNRVAQAKLQKIEALHAKQQTVLRRKTEEAEAARRRLKELNISNKSVEAKNRRAANEGGSQNAAGMGLKDDKARLEWLEQELDSCNQSLVLKRVLDGEVEQRKHASRQLIEVEKRLDHVQAATIGDNVPARLAETYETLLKRKGELEGKIAHHSSQIAEIQKMYEQAKGAEERTGAVSDVKRWNPLRTVAESRTMLKILFKIASDQKVQANEYYNENSRLAEESAELQEKLEIMTQEVQALRRNLVRAEAAAVAAVSLSSKFGAAQTSQDKSDSDVEDLLQQISDVATTPNRRSLSPYFTSVGHSVRAETINVMLGEQNGAQEEDGMHQDGESDGFTDSSDDSDWEPDGEAEDEDYEASPNGKLHQKSSNATNKADEQEVLHFINVRLARRGEACAQRLTIPLMEKELKLTLPNWHRGRKSRDILIQEIKTRVMGQSTGQGKAAGSWAQDSASVRVNLPDKLNCATPQAREFLKKREDMMLRLQRAQERSRSVRRPHESPSA